MGQGINSQVCGVSSQCRHGHAAGLSLGNLPGGPQKLSAAELRRKAEQYASRFDILDDAWTGVLSKLEQRQSLHEAFRGPAERGTHQAGVGTIVNAPECIAAMEATFVHAPAVTSAADMRALFRNLFHVFDVTGSGRVDYREIVCAMEFCSEPWDAQPLALMTRWYRFYEGGLAGLHFQDFVKMMLTLAVNKDEAQAVLKRLSRELIVRVAMEVPIRLGGLKAGSDPHSANARAGDSLLPQVDMYAGIPVGVFGAAARPVQQPPADSSQSWASSAPVSARSRSTLIQAASSCLMPPTIGLPPLSRSRTLASGDFRRPGSAVPLRRSAPAVGNDPHSSGAGRKQIAAAAAAADTATLPLVRASAPGRRRSFASGGVGVQARAALEAARSSSSHPARAGSPADGSSSASHSSRRHIDPDNVRVTAAMLKPLLELQPGLAQAIERMRFGRAPAMTRARILRGELEDEAELAVERFQGVSERVASRLALKHWRQQTKRSFFRHWAVAAAKEKQARLRMWRHRTRGAILWWLKCTRQSRSWRREKRLAALHGYMLIQRRAFTGWAAWHARLRERRAVQARRADARFRLRTQEHALAKLRLAVKLGIAERHFDSTSTAKAWRRWQAGCEVVRHERLAMEAASLITGRQISSMEDVAVVAGVVDAEAAAREAAKQQESMAMAGFFEEADFAAQIEEELSAEEERARRMRAQKLDMQRAASLRQRGLSRHAAWLTKLEKDSAQRVRAKVEEVRSAALEAVGEVLPLADDWAEVIEPDFQTAGLCRAGAIGSISFEQLGTSLVEKERPCARAPTEERHATAGSERTAPSARSLVTSSDAAGDARGSPPPASRLQAVIQEHPGAAALAIAMVKVARTQTAGPLRQPLSEWVVETDGVEGVTGFLNTVSAERIHQERMSAVDVLDVACGHLVGGACAAARSLQLESEEAALRASVADRISSLLGREFRRQRARAVALEQARQAVEEQVDPSTGQLVYFNSSTREPLAKKPTMFGKGPVWPRPDWQLRVEPATGVAFYEHRTSPWRSRRQPPRGFPLCFNCQVQLADRRCLGPECNGYLFCWDCWSTHHPAASAEYSAHAVRRLGASALKCDRCAAGTLRGARFIVWAPGYPAICTACKVSGGHADEELVVF